MISSIGSGSFFRPVCDVDSVVANEFSVAFVTTNCIETCAESVFQAAIVGLDTFVNIFALFCYLFKFKPDGTVADEAAGCVDAVEVDAAVVKSGAVWNADFFADFSADWSAYFIAITVCCAFVDAVVGADVFADVGAGLFAFVDIGTSSTLITVVDICELVSIMSTSI